MIEFVYNQDRFVEIYYENKYQEIYQEKLEREVESAVESAVKSAVESTVEKTKTRTALKMLREGKLTMEQIAFYQDLPIDTVRRLSDELLTLA
ncbi:MAG: hypothetical protein LUH19_01560 [Lachnospiraceae bacterium]|nr:hypothetical protein [Lachnospiraceae bacterium]